MGIRILTDYRNFEAPADAESCVQELLRYVPEERIRGIRSITLTNSESSREWRRMMVGPPGRRIPANECLGLYNRTGEIRLLIDNILRRQPSWLMRWRFARTLVLGLTLFHEIGHHIHAHQRPEHKDKEAVADEWQSRLVIMYLEGRFWYARPLMRLARYMGGTDPRSTRRWSLVMAVLTTAATGRFVQRILVGHGMSTVSYVTGVMLCALALYFWFRFVRERTVTGDRSKPRGG